MPHAPINWPEAIIMVARILMWATLFHLTFLSGPQLYRYVRECWRLGHDDNAAAMGRLRRWRERWQRGEEKQRLQWLKARAAKEIRQRREWREAQRAALEEDRAMIAGKASNHWANLPEGKGGI